MNPDEIMRLASQLAAQQQRGSMPELTRIPQDQIDYSSVNRNRTRARIMQAGQELRIMPSEEFLNSGRPASDSDTRLFDYLNNF